MSIETQPPIWRLWLWPAMIGIAIAIANVLVFILLPPNLVDLQLLRLGVEH